ncbi:MAG: hypothetical protein U9Q30_10590 [Campylobacterota bacterium]|nr:hypothetical protein [Campylobacterota bacterium]
MIKTYFRLYRRFLSIDLVNSLRKEGRNDKIIFDFFKTLIVLVKKDNSSENKNQSLNDLEEIILEYEKIYNTPHRFKIHQSLTNEDKFDINNFMKYFPEIIKTNILNELAYSIALFQKLSINEEFESNLISNKISGLHLQSIIEFNNAISHIHKCYSSNKDIEGNIKKAIIHLYRGVLDIYKTLILHKKGTFSSQEILDLTNLRLLEVHNIGESIEFKKQDNSIINKYKELIKKLYKIT